MFRDRLLIQFDQGDPKDGLSKLLALDGRTGQTVWSAPREKIANSWPTPLVINYQGRHQIITCADPWVIAYDATDGSEIWRVNCLRQDVGPSPAYAAGAVYAVNEYPQLTAIRPDGKGDVTETHVLWVGEDGLPDCPSPLAAEKRVFVLASYGYLTCYDAATGEMLWEWEADDASFTSSPSMAGNRIYLFGLEGKSWVFDLGEEGGKVDDDGMLTPENIVGTGQLGEDCVTSPAFQEGRIYIRGKEHLFALGEK
jgi:outer membrane protein assembly factor BamB